MAAATATSLVWLTCGMLTPFKTHFVSGIPEPLDHGLYQTSPNAAALRVLLINHSHPNAVPYRFISETNTNTNKTISITSSIAGDSDVVSVVITTGRLYRFRLCTGCYLVGYLIACRIVEGLLRVGNRGVVRLLVKNHPERSLQCTQVRFHARKTVAA